MGLADNLWGARIRARYSRTGLGEKAGVNPRTIEAIETGQSFNPGIQTVAFLASALGMTVNELLGEVEEDADS